VGDAFLESPSGFDVGTPTKTPKAQEVLSTAVWKPSRTFIPPPTPAASGGQRAA
jgi:hypothetical protein